MQRSIIFVAAIVCLMSCVIEQVYTMEPEISLLADMDASYLKHATELQTAVNDQDIKRHEKQLNEELGRKINAYLHKKFALEELPDSYSGLVFDITQIHINSRLISHLQNPTLLRHKHDAPELQISKIVEKFIQEKPKQKTSEPVKEGTLHAKGDVQGKGDT
ncbi:hypothetical protein DdX_20765 [Ditylenchus destructor]|uniref:Uncharacterized protein n=1 Tax=Ditylenchus destructor TaxID=166010 RepID=A0AAD4QW92_9BILA|nr:hypothetical protein DdX_20765 [Ditylenchus destructor]